MLKILQARLQQYVNRELPDVQGGFRKGRGTRDQLPTSVSERKQENSRKKICFTDYAKAFDCMDHNKLWEILKEMGILDHLTCLLRNLHAGQEVTELDIKQYWFKIGERVHQGCILSTYLFNLHAEYIMRNAGLNDSQAEIKIACLLSHVHLFATP